MDSCLLLDFKMLIVLIANIFIGIFFFKPFQLQVKIKPKNNYQESYSNSTESEKKIVIGIRILHVSLS